MMIKVGITGGIGSGKTLVSGIFTRLGIPVFYADKEANQIVKTDEKVFAHLKKIFSEDIVDVHGQPDRKKLRELIFKNDEARFQVNQLVHPIVQQRFEDWCSMQKEVPFVLKEAAILFESGSYVGLDKVIVVTAPEQTRIDRVVQRDGVSEEQVRSIIAIQLDEKEKINRGDFIIENDEQQLLIPRVLDIFNELKAISAKTLNGTK